MTEQTDPELDPRGEHDAEALKEGAERMGAKVDGDEEHDPDPEDDHDPEALEEAAERMRTEP